MIAAASSREIETLEALGRTRALTEGESRRLEWLLKGSVRKRPPAQARRLSAAALRDEKVAIGVDMVGTDLLAWADRRLSTLRTVSPRDRVLIFATAAIGVSMSMLIAAGMPPAAAAAAVGAVVADAAGERAI